MPMPIEKRVLNLNVRLQPRERDAIRGAADKAEMRVSAFVRSAVMEATREVLKGSSPTREVLASRESAACR